MSFHPPQWIRNVLSICRDYSFESSRICLWALDIFIFDGSFFHSSMKSFSFFPKLDGEHWWTGLVLQSPIFIWIQLGLSKTLSSLSSSHSVVVFVFVSIHVTLDGNELFRSSCWKATPEHDTSTMVGMLLGVGMYLVCLDQKAQNLFPNALIFCHMQISMLC